MTPELKKRLLQVALRDHDLRQEIVSLIRGGEEPAPQSTHIKVTPESGETLEPHEVLQDIRTDQDESEFPSSDGPGTTPTLLLQSPSGKIKIFLIERFRKGKKRFIKGVLMSEKHKPLVFEMQIDCPNFFGRRIAGGISNKVTK